MGGHSWVGPFSRDYGILYSTRPLQAIGLEVGVVNLDIGKSSLKASKLIMEKLLRL